MINITISNPEELLKNESIQSLDLDRYIKTLNVQECQKRDYQKNFTAYYKVRRHKNWLCYFYDFLFLNKTNKTLIFEDVLRALYKNKMLETSFASKLLHTINPDFPIWDSNIKRALLFTDSDPSWPFEDRLSYTINQYKELTAKIHNFINSAEGQYCIKVFNDKFPDYKHINNVKKIDFYLFIIGKNKSR